MTAVMGTILIIDDEADIRDLLADIFEDEGYAVLKAAHSEQALSIVATNAVDLIVLDIWLDNSDMDGMQILKHLKKKDNNRNQIPVLMISGHGNVEMAVNAMKIGAFDFIEKPFKIDHILLTVRRAMEQKSLRDENIRLKDTQDLSEAQAQYKSPAMIQLMRQINDNAESEARVMITGAFGVGKTSLAQLIHDRSKRSYHPMTTVYADDFKIEGFHQAVTHNPKGSILLKSIQLLDNQAQADLLYYLNKHPINTRLICTADESLAQRIKDQTFSSALYDRMAVISYRIPSLKERMEDFELITKVCMEKLKSRLSAEGLNIDMTACDMTPLYNQDWPGNIRQLSIILENMIYSSILSLQGQKVSKSDQYVAHHGNILPYPATHTPLQIDRSGLSNDYYTKPLKQARDQFEYDYLSRMLDQFDGNIARMAHFIEMDRTALYRKLKTMNLTSDTSKSAEAGQS